MRKYTRLLLLAMLLTLIPGSSIAVDAANDWTSCNAALNGSTLAAWRATVSGKNPKCFEFNETQSTTDVTITINAVQAKVCLYTDTQSATIGDVRATLYDCARGLAPTLSTCSVVAAKTYTTDACFVATNGIYLFDITTAVSSGEVAILYVQPY